MSKHSNRARSSTNPTRLSPVGHQHSHVGSADTRTVPRPLQLLAALHELDRLRGVGSHSLQEIADYTGLAKPTICRVLVICTAAGLATRVERGRYALSDSEATSPMTDSPEMHPLLSALHETTRYPVLVFVPAVLPGVTQKRILVSHQFGDNRRQLLQAPRDRQEALMQAPLDADAAGLVILAALDQSPTPTLQTQRIRERGYASTPSALVGLSLLAAPVILPCADGTPAIQAVAALALLVPDGDLVRPAIKDVLVREIVDSAEYYGQHGTHAEPPHPLPLARQAS